MPGLWGGCGKAGQAAGAGDWWADGVYRYRLSLFRIVSLSGQGLRPALSCDFHPFFVAIEVAKEAAIIS